ncbi:MAG: hypothetical protein N2554_07420, partial [Fimbriimonadales bacterium]|nr:hypothetical protein [Fimbriimonadales bacterium]
MEEMKLKPEDRGTGVPTRADEDRGTGVPARAEDGLPTDSGMGVPARAGNGLDGDTQATEGGLRLGEDAQATEQFLSLIHI